MQHSVHPRCHGENASPEDSCARKDEKQKGDLSFSTKYLRWSASPRGEICESLVDQTHRVEEKSRIADRRCSNGPSISSPRSRIYQAHGVSTIAVVWISCSAWVVCITQPRMARNGSAPGPWDSSAPTHRFFVLTKSCCSVYATPQHSHREESERNFHGRCMATLSVCHQSLTEIGSEATEIEYHPRGVVTYVAKGSLL